MRNIHSYAIGDVPTFNPCNDCIVKMICNSICNKKILFDKNNKKPPIIQLKSKRRRKRK